MTPRKVHFHQDVECQIARVDIGQGPVSGTAVRHGGSGYGYGRWGVPGCSMGTVGRGRVWYRSGMDPG